MNSAEMIGELIGYMAVYLIPTMIGAKRRVVNPLFTITWVSNVIAGAGMYFLPEQYVLLRFACLAAYILSFGLALNKNVRPKVA
jgi:hypothetical protein